MSEPCCWPVPGAPDDVCGEPAAEGEYFCAAHGSRALGADESTRGVALKNMARRDARKRRAPAPAGADFWTAVFGRSPYLRKP